MVFTNLEHFIRYCTGTFLNLHASSGRTPAAHFEWLIVFFATRAKQFELYIHCSDVTLTWLVWCKMRLKHWICGLLKEKGIMFTYQPVTVLFLHRLSWKFWVFHSTGYFTLFTDLGDHSTVNVMRYDRWLTIYNRFITFLSSVTLKDVQEGDSNWYSSLSSTGWLANVSRCLGASLRVADQIAIKGISVVLRGE